MRPSSPAEDGSAFDSLAPLAPAQYPAEAAFYARYRWCLNAYPTLAELRRRLGAELAFLLEVPEDWRHEEVCANVFLLSCALADSVDDHLAGDAWDFSQAVAVLPPLRLPVRAFGLLSAGVGRWRDARLERLREWREAWGTASRRFLQASLVSPARETAPLLAAGAGLRSLLGERWDARLLRRRSKAPAAFRNQDLSHHDVLELAGRFAAAFPDQRQPLLVVGLRSAGSYLAPLAHAALAARGYADIEAVTLRPKRGITRFEKRALERGARRGALALVVDEPPDTGATLARVVELL